jgi:hypothetical protein
MRGIDRGERSIVLLNLSKAGAGALGIKVAI